MLDKFAIISKGIFGIKGYSYSYPTKIGTICYVFTFGCKKFVSNFETLQLSFKHVNPPDWIIETNELFGAYLAGVIDGDGDTRISRPKYPQCYIRVYSEIEINKFVGSIKKLMNCGFLLKEGLE